MREAAKHGLSDRLAFTDLLNSNLRIAGKALADLFLDTPEYNAHGTGAITPTGRVFIAAY